MHSCNCGARRLTIALSGKSTLRRSSMDSDKAPSQMVASTQSGPVIAIGWARALKQPKLSRTRASASRADEKVLETNNEVGEGWERVNRSRLVSTSARAGPGWRIADSQVGEERERCKCEETRGWRVSRIAIRSTSTSPREFGVFVRGGDYCFREETERSET